MKLPSICDISQRLTRFYKTILVSLVATLDKVGQSSPPRLYGTLIATVFLLVTIAILAPQQLGVSLYKLSLVTMSGVVGYWIDRELFPYARPDRFIQLKPDADGGNTLETLSTAFAAANIRRAIIVGCAMLAMGMGA
jgi:hypothetical protein